MLVKSLRCLFRATQIKFVYKRACSSAADPLQDHCEPHYDTRILKVAIIGTPNAGKSTFINNIMDRKVCATSSKVHTTRGKAMAVFTAYDAQIVFIDTPGLVSDKEQKRYNLEKSFARDSKRVVKEADIVGVVHDVTNVWTREKLDIKVIKLLEYYKNTPSFLVLNKIDVLKSKRKLLDLTRQLTENRLDGAPIPGSPKLKKENESVRGWPNFSEIFMISALTGDGLSQIKDYLINQAKPGKWMFPEQVWTDQSHEQIITNSVKGKLLDFLPQEIPYNLTPELEYFDIDKKGVVSAAVIINCPTEKMARLVAGASDGKLKQITESLQHDLQDTFQNYVRINLILKPVKT
ncbi:hypothetical protein NQ315_001532 [Exocentrus adspersus]|uniref:GTPase Era, mitochondrial n=1 Tax=Exocentrus adspersus TaxID=1586481 RepID=A0AAV8W926_9CUCU|nr:hypothetical protein NQ315_001532 [Exocentrus adspersus]